MTWNEPSPTKQHDAAVRRGQAGSERGADGVADRAVEGLADELRPLRHEGLGRTEEGNARLGDHHGAGLQEVADPVEEAADGQRPVRLGLEGGRAPVDAALGGALEVQRGGVPFFEPPGETADEVAQRNGG